MGRGRPVMGWAGTRHGGPRKLDPPLPLVGLDRRDQQVPVQPLPPFQKLQALVS